MEKLNNKLTFDNKIADRPQSATHATIDDASIPNQSRMKFMNWVGDSNADNRISKHREIDISQGFNHRPITVELL